MVSPSKMPSIELAAFGHAKDFRQRPRRRVAFEARHRARRQDQHAVRGFAAQRLLPREGHDIELGPFERLREGGRGRVANGQARAIGGDPVGVRHAHARGGAVPGEDHVACRIDLGEIGQFAVAGAEHGHVLELELLDHVDDPAFAERFPGQQRRPGAGRAATTSPSRPRRYRTPARCRSGNRPAPAALRG